MIQPRPRPRSVGGITTEVKTGCGAVYVTINADEKGIVDVFVRFGKNGSCNASQTEAISRLLSLAFRCDIDVEEIIRCIKGIRCCSPAYDHDTQILSCADAIAKAIELYLNAKQKS